MFSSRELSQMKLKELQKLEDELSEAIKVRKATEAGEVRKELADVAKRRGFASLEEIFGKKLFGAKGGRGYKSTMAPKYRDPSDPAKTWSGHGRKPNWLVAKIDKGASLDEFRA